MNFFLKWRMRISGARIFLSLLAGKFDKIEQKLPLNKREPKIKLRKILLILNMR